MPATPHSRPRIALTAHLEDGRTQLRDAYLDAVVQAGGLPLILAPQPGMAATALDHVDGVIMTGGDDPDMRLFGEPLHPKATLIDPRRQTFEMELLEALDAREDLPVLAICLGMQLMGLHAGGKLDQYLPDHLPTAEEHWNGALHTVSGTLGSGYVHSHHRQALCDAGRLLVTATSPDGVIEAIKDPLVPFRVGVQWHPERTPDPLLGAGLFEALIHAAVVRPNNTVAHNDP